jgi:protein phosphatase
MKELKPVAEVSIPELALVVIAGNAQQLGIFTTRWFSAEEIIEVSGAVDVARRAIAERLAAGLLAVVALHERESDAALGLTALARQHDIASVALLISDCEWPAGRFPSGPHGFTSVSRVNPDARLERVALPCNRREERGPFDIIGDVHGCYEELLELFARLGYVTDTAAGMRAPRGRRAVFVGDLVDRGPGVVETIHLAMRMVAAGTAFCVPGNHDDKLARALMGRPVWIAHGLRESLSQIECLPGAQADTLSAAFQSFVRGLPPYLVLDGGALVVAHAGLPERFHGRVSGRIRSLILYGEQIGEDEDGLPIRVDWAADYHGAAAVVYGHTPQRDALWRHNTINCDTGCVFGNKLTAVRWPEREIISVPAREEYARRARPL